MVQTASVGPWIVAVPAACALSALGHDTPLWLSPGGQLLVLHDDLAVPALDLPARWNAPSAAPAPTSAVLMLQAQPDAPRFALRVDCVGRRQSLMFWPLPPALQSLCGVQAAALIGVPWQPESAPGVGEPTCPPWGTRTPEAALRFLESAPKPAAFASGPPRGMRKLGAARRFLMCAPRPAAARQAPRGGENHLGRPGVFLGSDQLVLLLDLNWLSSEVGA
jgi:hypothetical protein